MYMVDAESKGQPFATKEQLLMLLGLLIATVVMAVPGHIGSYWSWPWDRPGLGFTTLMICWAATGKAIGFLILWTTSPRPLQPEPVEGQPVRQNSQIGCTLAWVSLILVFAVLARLAVTKSGTATHTQVLAALVVLAITFSLALRKVRSTRTRLLLEGQEHWFPDQESALRFLVAHEEERRGPDHPRVADRLRELAEWIATQAMRPESAHRRATRLEPICRRVLSIREKSLGKGHLETAISRLGWAQCSLLLGDVQQSQDQREQALETLRHLQSFHVEDNGIADRSGQIALRLQLSAAMALEKGRIEEAAEFCSWAFRVCAESFPANDPRLANEYRKSALFERDHGQLDEAKALMQQAIELAGSEARNGVVGPDVLAKEYAEILHRMRKPEPEPDL
jgi:hypothetical protein